MSHWTMTYNRTPFFPVKRNSIPFIFSRRSYSAVYKSTRNPPCALTRTNAHIKITLYLYVRRKPSHITAIQFRFLIPVPSPITEGRFANLGRDGIKYGLKCFKSYTFLRPNFPNFTSVTYRRRPFS